MREKINFATNKAIRSANHTDRSRYNVAYDCWKRLGHNNSQ